MYIDILHIPWYHIDIDIKHKRYRLLVKHADNIVKRVSATCHRGNNINADKLTL